MAAETKADLPTLDSIAGRLNLAADALDAVGKASPGVPDAGEVSGLMGAAIAHLSENAGNIVLGMKGAGEEVTAARQDYAGTDRSAAASFGGY
jgi:hypothetical protein